MEWVVYGLICARRDMTVTYIGVTNNWTKRWNTHVSRKGARFTKSFPPIMGGILVSGLNKGSALRLERLFKKLPKKTKVKMIAAAKEIQTIIQNGAKK